MRNAMLVLLPEATHDRGFAMTSSFSCMLLAAALVFGAIETAAVARLVASPRRALLPRRRRWRSGWSRARFERVVYLGSNELRGLALEAALKLLELTDGRVVAVADSTLGFRHGPKTIINDRTLVVVMLSNDAYTRAYDVDLLEELRRDGRAGGDPGARRAARRHRRASTRSSIRRHGRGDRSRAGAAARPWSRRAMRCCSRSRSA